MRFLGLGPFLAVSLLVPATAIHAQQPTPAAPAPREAQAVLILQRSLAALAGTSTINDVALNGTATRIAGSDNESGTATLKATAIGQSRIDLSLSSGQSSEVRDTSTEPFTGSWCGPDGTWHPVAAHNLFAISDWFFPEFLIARVLSTPGYAISAVDSEIRAGIAVQHFAVYQQNDATLQLSPPIQALSRVDIYLNSSNLLPVALTFKVHPDSDAGTDISVEVKFSNYQSVQGAAIPYHVQKYVNDGLVLDLAIQSSRFNSGLPSSDFQAQ